MVTDDPNQVGNTDKDSSTYTNWQPPGDDDMVSYRYGTLKEIHQMANKDRDMRLRYKNLFLVTLGFLVGHLLVDIARWWLNVKLL